MGQASLGYRGPRDSVASSSEAQIILADENDYPQYLYHIHEVCNLEYGDKVIIMPLSRPLTES